MMTPDRTAGDPTVPAARARLDRLIEKLGAYDDALAGVDPPLPEGQLDSVLLRSAVGALQYARDTVAAVIGDLDAVASAEVAEALGGLIETSPQPWGDSALNDLERISERSARLLADIWMVGRLTVAAEPSTWSNDTMIQQCLQVVAETHLAGKLRAELDGMFGSTDEPL
ncbi:MAG: hypothetical protein JWO79_1655 [Actinomycetia bacterium]|jgi:hypothetical protein|nr:hypothetical protein [Actinomycetes bacterium]MDQ1659670.1 hypothetical protein [Cryptosporangiaceae bacterium]